MIESARNLSGAGGRWHTDMDAAPLICPPCEPASASGADAGPVTAVATMRTGAEVSEVAGPSVVPNPNLNPNPSEVPAGPSEVPAGPPDFPRRKKRAVEYLLEGNSVKQNRVRRGIPTPSLPIWSEVPHTT